MTQIQLTPSSESDESRQHVTRRVAIWGMTVNIILTIAQIIGGLMTHSQALVADAMHTLSDLVGDLIVLFASHHANKAADEEHPYGHGRIETLATVVLGLLLGAVAVIIFLNGWDRLSGKSPLVVPSPTAMLFAGLAIIGKEALYQYTVHIAKRIHSPMLKASAWHHRSDAISSILVLFAIAGAQFGYPWLDPIAAMIVAAMIFYMAVQLLWDSSNELVDTGLTGTELQAVREFITTQEGVENLHFLRTRRVSGQILADVHLQVDGRITVSEGHYIGEAMLYKLRKQFPNITDVTVHIDSEDDETGSPSRTLPSRAHIVGHLKAIPQINALWPQIEQLYIHYINGHIALEWLVNTNLSEESLILIKQACKTLESVDNVTFLRRIELK